MCLHYWGPSDASKGMVGDGELSDPPDDVRNALNALDHDCSSVSDVETTSDVEMASAEDPGRGTRLAQTRAGRWTLDVAQSFLVLAFNIKLQNPYVPSPQKTPNTRVHSMESRTRGQHYSPCVMIRASRLTNVSSVGSCLQFTLKNYKKAVKHFTEYGLL
jgi:hypothetical protein